MLFRLVFLGLFLLLLTYLMDDEIAFHAFLVDDEIAFHALLAFAYVVSIPYALWIRNKIAETRFIDLQFGIDLVVVTVVVYVTGGIDSELALLYPMIILSSGIVASPVRAMQMSFLCALTYMALIVLEGCEFLPAVGGLSSLYNRWDLVTQTMAMRFFVFMCFGAAGVHLAQRCEYQDRKMSQFREMTDIIFHHVNAGLMLLNAKGTIIMVNDRSCQLLGYEEGELRGKPINAVMEMREPTSTIEELIEAEETGMFSMKREDGFRFPVSFELSGLTLPAEAVRGAKGAEAVDVSILVFRNIARDLDLKRKVKEAHRMKETVAIANQIAHEICNPLAAISASVQVLQVLQRRAHLGDPSSEQLLESEYRAMYDRIVSEARRIDKFMAQLHRANYTSKVQRFVDEALDGGSRPRLGGDSETHDP